MILNCEFTNSSMLSSVSYDTETKEMTVVFLNGKQYIYEDVDKSIYDGMVKAQSAGKYFNSIKKDLKVKQ